MAAYSSDTYNNFLQELKGVEKMIQNDLKELRINVGNNVNTSNTENSIKKNLDKYVGKINQFHDDYARNVKDIKFSVPEREYNRRVNEVQEVKNNYDRMKGQYEGLLDTKYKYKGSGLTENQQEEDTIQNMNNKQAFDYSKKKLKDQDSQIDDMIGITKKGKELGKELKGELINQNLKLDDVEKDVDRVQSRMEKTRNKFSKYIESSSTCGVTTVVVLELVALVTILLFW